MSARIVLGIADPALAAAIEAMAAEARDIEVVATVRDTDDVVAAIGRGDLDAAVVHQDLGPLPVLELARQLGASYPTVAFILLAREVGSELLHQAMRAGVREVLPMPVTGEALSEAIASASMRSRAVRDRIDDDGLAQVAERIGGRVLAVAGAKGGVGTTTIALQLAVAAARSDPDRTVCLAELDLQAGDLRAFLDLSSRRSIADLVAVAEELTVRSLDETLYVHESGLRVLLAPEHGELAEDLTEPAARRILGALKFQYDLVVCDVGAVMTETSAVAVELAGDVLVVCTPDVPALRAANRLVRLWERIHARTDGITLVLNRTHKESEIQPEFARKVSSIPVARTVIPGGFRALETAVNTGVPERIQPGPVRDSIAALAEEVGATRRSEPRRRLRLRAAVRAQEGQASVETAGLVLVVALLLLGLWQIVLTGYTFELAGHSAREGSRALAVGEDARSRAREDLPRPWRTGMRYKDGEDWVEVTVRVPLVIPGVDTPIRVSDRKRTVIEGEPLPEEFER